MQINLPGLAALLLAAGSLASCRETSRLPEPAYENLPLILPQINPQKSFFNSTIARISANSPTAPTLVRPVFEFVVAPSQGYAELQTVEVYKSFYSNSSKSLGPRVKAMDLTSFPATVSINSQEAITDLYPAATPAKPIPDPVVNTSVPQGNRLLPFDAVVFTFEYVLKDGRRIILTPISKTPGSVGVAIGTQVNAPYAAIATFKSQ